MGQRGGPGGQKGGPGGQGDGQGGRGPGGKGVDNTTQAGATAQLAAAAKDIETAKTDLTAAKGKMDTTQVEALLAKADGLYSQADGFLKASDFVKASGYAAAAKDVVRSATELMENELGTALPSAANRPARPAQATAPADGGKAMASHQLANVYNQIVRAGTEAKANATITDAASFVTSAQDLYKKAYDLYNAGEYEKAAKTGQAAGDLAHVVESLMRANGVQPTNQPETVPAPNF
jgi:hypothetical protein